MRSSSSPLVRMITRTYCMTRVRPEPWTAHPCNSNKYKGNPLASHLVDPGEEGTMTKFLAGVLSVISVGVLLIAYGLLNPAVPAYADQAPFARPMLANETMMLRDPAYASYANPAYAYPANQYQPMAAPVAAPIRTASTIQPATRVVERAPRRDWKKTALVIGGSTATGAGVGAIFGGKKGALIGAAIGGGASTIYESQKK